MTRADHLKIAADTDISAGKERDTSPSGSGKAATELGNGMGEGRMST
jgi:hypothetical protein